MKTFAAFASLVGLAAAELLWDGRFNDLTSATDLDKWSWSNQVGPYQYYIHGTGNVTEYVNLAADYGNPADTGSSKGAKISLTDTAYWNGQTMRRTELIPQTTAKIAAGKVYYHFSIKRTDVNAPSLKREHQIAFFESHFTELKSGLLSGASGTEDNSLRWMVGGTSKWDVQWEAGVWHNVAYEIDFDAKTVSLWHSTDASDLKQVVAPVTASTSSNGADWHVGVLELANGDTDENEDFYFSGVYIENGDLTTSVSGPGGNSTSSTGSSGSTGSSDTSSAVETAVSSTLKASTTPVATATLADLTTLISSTIPAVKTTQAAQTSAAAAAESTAAAADSSAAPAESSAPVESAVPVESAATQASTLAAATPTTGSRCKLSRRARQRRSL